jgi:hypothetical protein
LLFLRRLWRLSRFKEKMSSLWSKDARLLKTYPKSSLSADSASLTSIKKRLKFLKNSEELLAKEYSFSRISFSRSDSRVSLVQISPTRWAFKWACTKKFRLLYCICKLWLSNCIIASLISPNWWSASVFFAVSVGVTMSQYCRISRHRSDCCLFVGVSSLSPSSKRTAILTSSSIANFVGSDT